MGVVRAAALYFAIVFVAAFGLGTARTLLLEPAFGKTMAVAAETPILIVVMYFAARKVVVGGGARSNRALLGVGALAALFQLCGEYALALAFGQSIEAHFAYLRSPAGLIYLGAVAVFALMPFLAAEAPLAIAYSVLLETTPIPGFAEGEVRDP